MNANEFSWVKYVNICTWGKNAFFIYCTIFLDIAVVIQGWPCNLRDPKLKSVFPLSSAVNITMWKGKTSCATTSGIQWSMKQYWSSLSSHLNLQKIIDEFWLINKWIVSRRVVIAIQGIAPLKGCLQALELMDFQTNIGFILVIENYFETEWTINNAVCIIKVMFKQVLQLKNAVKITHCTFFYIITVGVTTGIYRTQQYK